MRDDLFEALRTPPPVEPLAPTEVRRRGDRLRRRRTTLQVVGAAAVVAVVAAGGLSIADRSKGTEPPQIERPKQTRTTPQAPKIRDDFPLIAGWPEVTGDGSLEGPNRSTDHTIEWFHCGIGKVPPGGDKLRAMRTEGSAGYNRELHTYADVAAASNAWATLLEKHEACTTWQDENGERYTAQVTLLENGARFQVTEWNASVYAGSAIVAREGKALVVETAGTEGHGVEAARQVAADQAEQLEPLLEAMCEFTPAGCAGDPSHPELADFPLTRNWPVAEGTLERMLDGPETVGLCGLTLDAVPTPVGFRGAILNDNDPGATRTRGLWTFDSEADAREFIDVTERVVCRRTVHEDGTLRTGEVTRRASDGGEILTVTQQFERDGRPIEGNWLEGAQVVRQGRVVLVSTLSDNQFYKGGVQELAAVVLDELEGLVPELKELA